MAKPENIAHPSAQYSITARLEYPHKAGWIAKIAGVIGACGGLIRAIDLVDIHSDLSVRDYTIDCDSIDHATEITQALQSLSEIVVHSVSDDTFLMHLGGKLEVCSKVPLKTRSELSMAYTPGVARVSRAIEKDVNSSFNLTIRKNCIAIVSNGTAVLGLGNVGPYAAMPVMEGKAILFKEFGDVDAVPLCIEAASTREVVEFCKRIVPSFGGINLEDIAAPLCFEIESQLKDELDIPVFHDDQHGTAIVVLAGTINALRTLERDSAKMKLVVSGAGAAATACVKLLMKFGFGKIVVCDRQGAIHPDRDLSNNPAKSWIAENTNHEHETGTLQEVLSGADMFLGLSAPGILTRADIGRMNSQPIIFAMANPDPEIAPEEVEDLAAVIATGRSDYPNQINNVLAFPGVFRGALDVRATSINEKMKLAAAHAIADSIPPDRLSPEYIIPSVFDRKVARRVAGAVARAAKESGLSRRLPKLSSVSHL